MSVALTSIKRFISNAKRHIDKANREYAFYKNCEEPNHPYLKPENKQKHYLTAQQSYRQAREYLNKAMSLINSKEITESEIISYWNDVSNRLKDV